MVNLRAIPGTPSYPRNYPGPGIPSHEQPPSQVELFVRSPAPVSPPNPGPKKMTGGNPLYARQAPKPRLEKTDSGFLLHGMPAFPSRSDFDSESKYDTAVKAWRDKVDAESEAAMNAWNKTPEGVAWRAEKEAREARQEAREKAEREEVERAEAAQRAILEANQARLRDLTQPHYQAQEAWREGSDWYVYEPLYPKVPDPPRPDAWR